MTLKEYMENFGLESATSEELERYKELLLEWNKKINITRITEEDEVYVKHFLDSLSLFKSKYLTGNKSLIDIGTGGGFPGLVVKIYNKELDVTLLDSLNKRLVFLDEVINELGLRDVRTIHGRAEEMGRDSQYREQYDLATSRAVANLSTLLEYDLPFVKVGGYFISMKGPEYVDEVKNAEKALKILGGKIEEIIEIELPMDINHYLVIIKKVKETPGKYPRGGGKPKNKPL